MVSVCMVNQPLRHLCSLLSQKQVIKSEESPLKNLENHQMAQMAEPLLLVLSFGHGWLMIIKNDLYVVFIMYEQPVMIFRSKIAVL